MRAVILAAGRGERLMPLTRNTPKSLLELGNGYSVIEHQLEVLHGCGIDQVRIVTGYRSHQVEAKLKAPEYRFVECVFNPFFRITNNLVSAWLGLRDIREPALLINGDDVFSPSVILELLAAKPSAQTAVISEKESYDAEDMKVELGSEGRIERFSKSVPLERATGEAIGVTRFDRHGLHHLNRVLEAMLHEPENFSRFYLSAFNRMIQEGAEFQRLPCRSDDWAEIDFHPDVDAVKQSVLVHFPPPRLKSRPKD